MYHVKFPGLGINLTIDPIAFTIGGLSIHWYGVIIAVGFVLAFLYVILNSKRFGIDVDKVTDVVIVGLITGIIGARLYYVLFYPGNTYKEDPISILYINRGGIAIYGGIIGGLIGAVITAKIKKIDVLAMLDLAAIALLIGQGIGRWGNFTNQEAFGVQTNLPWGMVSENTLLQTPYPVHPCFLYESIWCLLGFALIHLFSLRLRKYDGQVFLLYLAWYGMERFIVEGLRTDSLIIQGLNLRVSQVLALVTLVVSIVLLIVFRSRNRLYVRSYIADTRELSINNFKG